MATVQIYYLDQSKKPICVNTRVESSTFPIGQYLESLKRLFNSDQNPLKTSNVKRTNMKSGDLIVIKYHGSGMELKYMVGDMAFIQE